MTKRLALAIQNMLDIQHKIRPISVWNAREVHQAFSDLYEMFHKEPESTIVSPGMHVHELSCWVDGNGQDQLFKICDKLDWFELTDANENLRREVNTLEHELMTLKELMTL